MFSLVDHYSVDLSEYKYILALIPYASTLLTLPIISKWSRPPQAVGKPYIHTKS